MDLVGVCRRDVSCDDDPRGGGERMDAFANARRDFLMCCEAVVSVMLQKAHRRAVCCLICLLASLLQFAPHRQYLVISSLRIVCLLHLPQIHWRYVLVCQSSELFLDCLVSVVIAIWRLIFPLNIPKGALLGVYLVTF